jgi:hypothetical protein
MTYGKKSEENIMKKLALGIGILMVLAFLVPPVSGGATTPGKATGGGKAVWPGGADTYAFTVQKDEDGNVKGEATFQLRSVGVTEVKGDIQCAYFWTGSSAWADLSGTITHATDPALIGQAFLFSVRDYGQGKDAPPDEVSQVRTSTTQDPAGWCIPGMVTTLAELKGNIQVTPVV